MELTFESGGLITTGSYPDIIQFYDTSAEVFSIVGGELKGNPIKKLNGVYDSPQLEEQVVLSPNAGITNFELKTINGFGAVGSYLTGATHKLLIYEYALEMDCFLEQATIRSAVGSAVSSFNMTLGNPVDEGSDKGETVAISERSSLLSPGSKVTFLFQAGDSDYYDLGEFYVDRSEFVLLRPDVRVDGRNLIGKALTEQTLDENIYFPYTTLDTHFKALLALANISSDQYLVETSAHYNSFTFKPTMKIMDAINEILKATINWKIDELPDGTVVIGSPTYGAFIQSGIYTFKRGSDIFSRSISRDDMQAYRRVCVHNSDFTVSVYRDVQTYTGWNLQSNKTLYVNVPTGTREADAILYADELAVRLENVGKVESFNGPFRPYLTVGDRAIIQDDLGNEDLGTITEITHTLGRRGYTTDFTVDSGGRIGKGRLSEYIDVITREKATGSIGYEEL